MPSGSTTVIPTSERPRRAPANFDTPADPGEAIRTGAAKARRVLKLFGQRPATRPGHIVIRQDTEDAWFIPADSTFDDVVSLPVGGHPLGWSPWPAAPCANRTFRTAGRTAMRAASRSPSRRRPG